MFVRHFPGRVRLGDTEGIEGGHSSGPGPGSILHVMSIAQSRLPPRSLSHICAVLTIPTKSLFTFHGAALDKLRSRTPVFDGATL